jgi:Pathogenicity locus
MAKNKHELLQLANIGPAALEDLICCKIDTIAKLAKQEPKQLYQTLNDLTGKRHDPCVLDVFSAAVHEARTGEKTPWWEWSRRRKAVL